MNAMPSDFPFKSTGFATYPVPPQVGQSFGLTPSPLVSWDDFLSRIFKVRGELFRVTNHEQESAGLLKGFDLVGNITTKTSVVRRHS
jgi:hypothetical protein